MGEPETSSPIGAAVDYLEQGSLEMCRPSGVADTSRFFAKEY